MSFSPQYFIIAVFCKISLFLNIPVWSCLHNWLNIVFWPGQAGSPQFADTPLRCSGTGGPVWTMWCPAVPGSTGHPSLYWGSALTGPAAARNECFQTAEWAHQVAMLWAEQVSSNAVWYSLTLKTIGTNLLRIVLFQDMSAQCVLQKFALLLKNNLFLFRCVVLSTCAVRATHGKLKKKKLLICFNTRWHVLTSL